ncbi:MAG: glycosyltransferase [Lachnospiraceae bacterium]|nr:glycosyltransferase [Lachnospiraceae bacterium]
MIEYTNPLCSIIVPVYNAEKTLENSIHSILKQSYDCLEIILVDDGSKDHSAEIIDKYLAEDARVKVIHQSNAGVSAARNRGIDSSVGNYICFVDSDDIVPPNYIEELIQESRKGYFSWCGIDEITEGWKTGRTDAKMFSTISDRRDVMKLSCIGILNPPYCKMYDGDLIRKRNMRFPVGCQIAEDLAFNLDYLDAIGSQIIKIVESTSYQYIRQEGSLDCRFVPNYWQIHREILKKQKKYAIKWMIPEEDWQLYYQRYWQYVSHALYNTMMDANEQSLKEKLQINNTLLKEKEVKESLRLSKKQIRKREYYIYRYFGYSVYYRLSKMVKR